MADDFDLSTLNPAQGQAITTLTGPVLILAGAGTGKTRTVTCRIAQLVRSGVPAENILAVTFTNKAAAEMRERVSGMVTKKQAKTMTISTFHSLCVKILRTDIERLGFKKNFTIITGGDQSGLIKQITVRKAGKTENLKPAQVLSEISKAKNGGFPLADIQDQLIADIAVEYQNQLRAQNAVDFDDLLLLTERLLGDYHDVRDRWRERFISITVDEFQDTNGLQMRLVQSLVGPHHNICVVGDDDQSIYGWRGAEVANILQFERFFPNPNVIRLEENYRSAESILHTANTLIRHNVGRREKQLRPTRKGGEPVRIISMPGDDEEATFIADEIVSYKNRNARKWEDFAILFRTNGQSRRLEEAMRENQIPYRMVGAQSFYDRREVRDTLAFIEILDNPEADVPLLRILNVPTRGIGNTTATLVIDHSRATDQSIWKVLQDDDFLSLISAKARSSIANFVQLTNRYRAFLHSPDANAGAVVREFLKEIDYLDFVHKTCKTPKEREQRAEGLQDIVAQLAKASDKGKTVRAFLDDSSLASDRDDDDLEKKLGVSLITMHASKGLEFPMVYIVGVEDGILPHKRSIEEDTRDEERRLLYVGITRAEERLTLTYCATRKKYGDRISCEPSSFLRELDLTFVEEVSYDELMNQETGVDAMASLLASFKKPEQ